MMQYHYYCSTKLQVVETSSDVVVGGETALPTGFCRFDARVYDYFMSLLYA